MTHAMAPRARQQADRRLPLPPLLPVVVLLVLVGLGATAHPGGSVVETHVTSLAALGDVLGAAAALAALSTAALLVLAFRPHRRRKGADEGYEMEPVEIEELSTRWQRILDWARLLLLAAVVVAGLVWVIGRVTQASAPSGRPRPSGRAVPTTAEVPVSRPGAAAHAVAWGSWEVVAVLAAVAVAAFLFVLVLRHHRRSRAGQVDQGVTDPSLAQVVEDALVELRDEQDAGRAVIRAYAAMERLFARRGRRRRADQTPFEYVESSLEKAGAPREAAIRLTDLFEQARFSDHVIGASLRSEAIGAFEAVRGATGVARGEGGAS